MPPKGPPSALVATLAWRPNGDPAIDVNFYVAIFVSTSELMTLFVSPTQ